MGEKMPENGLIQSQNLQQEQILSPRQLQSLEFLTAPVMELQQQISIAVAENPLLEVEQSSMEELAGDPLLSAMDADRRQAEAVEKEDDDSFEASSLPEEWQDFLPVPQEGNFDQSEAARKYDYWLNSLTGEPSLQEQLMEQLMLSDVSPLCRRAAEMVIGSLDERGYLASHLADIAMGADCSMQDAGQALALVQSFDPPGIGARDLAECLSLQLKRKKLYTPKLQELLERHLNDVGHNRLPQVARSMKISLDELTGLLEQLRDLNPHPGSGVAGGGSEVIVPEMEVQINEQKELILIGHDSFLPKLHISQRYLELLDDASTPSDVRKYLEEKLRSARELMGDLERRQSTLRRIAEVLLEEQYDFFYQGVEALKPLTMRQVGDKLDLHESTIGRAVGGKYLKTPFGVFEFKFFFSGGYRNADGDDVSSRAVKERIRQLIAEENPARPLSDDKISSLLAAEGFPVARRTVAKYREAMNIASSSLRRQFS